MDAFYSLVQKSTTSDNHLVFNTAITMDRSQITIMENNDTSQESVYHATSPIAYNNAEDLKDDDSFTVKHDDSIPPIPTLSIGCSVRYKQDDHVEVGKLVGVDLSNPASPTYYDILFPGGRKVHATREYIELEETPDIFDIPTKAKSILEVASSLSKKDLNAILNPDVLTPLQQLWMWWHEILDHLPRCAMNFLVEKGSLPPKFKSLKDWLFVCPSCLLAKRKEKVLEK